MYKKFAEKLPVDTGVLYQAARASLALPSVSVSTSPDAERTMRVSLACAGRRVAQEHGGRWPLPRRRDSHLSRRYPRKNGLVLDQQIVEFAPLHAFDESGDLSPGVDEGGAFRVA